jgi:hypothetical protein
MPYTTTDAVAMLKVFDPSRAGLELVLRNPEGFGNIPGPVTDQRIGKSDILRDRGSGQPINELALDLWEFGRSELREDQRWAIVGPPRGGKKYVPVFRNLEFFFGWNVHPLLFVLQDFADRAPFHTVFDGNVLLSSSGILFVIQTDLLTVYVEEPLLFVFSDHWCRVDLGLGIGWAGGGGYGRQGGRHAQGWRGGSGVRV